MLELYSASAGSGKTYTLAKKYIWYFITITSEEGDTRLRTDAELADSARHILAVTFTNKATNEMQMRIVKSLDALSSAPLEWGENKSGRRVIKKPDYMQDFVDELHVAPERIAETCRKALAILLENYSDFNVSTIDSFFQKVLRTFAYESDINDAYQVELDSKYLSQIGVDETLEEIDNNADDVHTSFWIKTIIDRTEKGRWNIFSRNQNDSFSENPYRSFISSVMKMETEQYKIKRKEIEDYFGNYENRENFIRLYLDLVDKYEKPVKRAFIKTRSAAKQLREALPLELQTASTRSDLGKFNLITRNLLEGKLKWNAELSASWTSCIKPDFLTEKKNVRKWMEDNGAEAQLVAGLFRELCDSFGEWQQNVGSAEFRHWRLYSVNLPYYALFSIVSRKRQEYLNEANAVELGETSMILRGVIGTSDTPFVYERLGTRLNHFLIDEFQDTSRLQWENLYPLLNESMSRGNGNLIIGDAKQSIYRFRNADSGLISRDVPEQFGDRVKKRGLEQSENTNYRSDLHVVQFNNSFFEFLASAIDAETDDPDGRRMKFEPIYANVVQSPDKTSDAGYVEVHLSGDSSEAAAQGVLDKLPELINGLLDRNYDQKDIAVLVSTHSEGSQVIDRLAAYNLERLPGQRELRFVSEQSLKVASSQAVGIIVGVLQNLAKGSNPEIREGEERRKKGVASMSDMMANFKFYRTRHPGMPVSELLDSYFREGNNFNALSDLLAEMQSLAIPAIVEAVAATFLDGHMLKKDAIYIAAFQDIVLEYCEGHPTDIGSFLKWWERKSESAAIASPEETDAVQIITVHKSKGLQYKCVIVPFAGWEMRDVMPSRIKKEWIWVEPAVISHDCLELPPYIPVETSVDMKGTVHEPLLNRYFDLAKMDRLNSAYVAFTRAEKELYIFANAKDAPKSNGSEGTSKSGVNAGAIGNYLLSFFGQLPDKDPSVTASPRLDAGEVTEEEDPLVFRIGKPVERFEKKEGQGDPLPLEEYKARRVPDFLKYHEDDLPVSMNDNDVSAVDEDLDPRSEGNIKHAVLELVTVPEDLPAAVGRLVRTGVVPDEMADSIEASLRKAITSRKPARWFDGTSRVINERPVLKKDYKTRRPDRLLVYPDGHCEVVDYKFGKYDNTGKYRRQIRNYVSLLMKTGLFKDVEGYLWYINADIIEKV